MQAFLFVALLGLVLPLVDEAAAEENTAAEAMPGTRLAAPYAPTAQYGARTVEGWRVLVRRELLEKEAALAADALRELELHLYQVSRRVPAAALAELRGVTIWLEEDDPHHACMAYHPNPQWLRAHGMNPDKARCVEIADARNFLDWTHDQPTMVLHELAHAYHHQFLPDGFDNAEVRAAYDEAMKAGLYEKVGHIRGHQEKAYAATNPQEYFAEASEALFGTNDFYPYVRPELRAHDPKFATLLARLWGVE